MQEVDEGGREGGMKGKNGAISTYDSDTKNSNIRHLLLYPRCRNNYNFENIYSYLKLCMQKKMNKWV